MSLRPARHSCHTVHVTIMGGKMGKNPSGGGCFIATAVYDNAMAPEVVTLRKFRDDVLRKSWVGRMFIATYYKVSPPIADWLRTQPKVSQVVRSILNRLVRLIK